MKKTVLFASLLGLLATQSIMAKESVTLDGVHLCCKACVKGVDQAISTVKGASSVSDQDSEQVTITASNKGTLVKSVNAMVNAGYYGTPDNASIKVKDISGAKNKKVKSLTVTGVHLCCGKCVTAVEDALSTVKGVSGNTAEKKVDSFKVMGNFNEKQVFAALNQAGMSGKAGH